LSVFAFGFGGGCINGATNAVISDISTDEKSANLSILGVFFAIGALGMPFILATLQDEFSIQSIVTIIGFLPLLFGVFFLLVSFPEAKQIKGTPLSTALALLRNPWLLVIGFFLFCQSGFEAIINNWTTSFLMQENHVGSTAALYALTLYVAAMALMRVIMGSALRKVTPKIILFISIAFLLTGSVLMKFSSTYYESVGGLISIGAGLAAGFPVMLAFVGNRYHDVSGTAFSVVISIALVGNMFINYAMGIVARNFGVGHLATLSGILTVLMLISSIIILKQSKS
ncbi:MAG TPA: MFS transporter, partial [Chryseolinea sp.]|nr:MFS transporter [Chryseolinea sp.]